tara:strand:+ start:1895 stop:2293 length:399 start_codon:yes stop_codon:yes gene_type:complete
MKISIARSSLDSIVNEVIEELVNNKELDEATLTGDIQGYNTPFAFAGTGSSNSKKKRFKNSTNSTGYKMVKEIRKSVLRTIRNRRDGVELNSENLVNEELTNRDFLTIKKMIRSEVAAILRDIWIKRSTWAA